MTMKASELVKKLGNKLLGKKEILAATVQALPVEQPKQMPLLDRLGVIQLHPYWRN
jgi:hypothetical protein